MARESLTVKIIHVKDGSTTEITELEEGVPVNDGYLYQSHNYLESLTKAALEKAYGAGIQKKDS